MSISCVLGILLSFTRTILLNLHNPPMMEVDFAKRKMQEAMRVEAKFSPSLPEELKSIEPSQMVMFGGKTSRMIRSHISTIGRGKNKLEKDEIWRKYWNQDSISSRGQTIKCL